VLSSGNKVISSDTKLISVIKWWENDTKWNYDESDIGETKWYWVTWGQVEKGALSATTATYWVGGKIICLELFVVEWKKGNIHDKMLVISKWYDRKWHWWYYDVSSDTQ
jgi:hypothetical protein